MVIAEKLMLTVTEVATKLRLAPRTVYRLIQAGELRAVRVSGNRLRIEEEALQKFIERNRTE